MRYVHPLFVFLALIWGTTAHADIQLPDGFRLSIFAKVPGARSLAPAPEKGIVFVGTRTDSVFAIYDQNQDGKADKVERILSNLKVPNGLAWKNDYLYVAEQHRLVRFAYGKWDKAEILFNGFPDKRWHGWRYAAFGPDGGLYVSVGAPCNICSLSGWEGTILRFEPETWVPTIFAHGVRNSVGITFDPINKDVLFTDNGADNMGDDRPADELNRAQLGGLHFGYPYYGGGASRTGEFQDHNIPPNRPPAHAFQAHVAPLGIHIYQGMRFPERYRDGIFVAQHGSWNRSEPVGYQISFLPFGPRGQIAGEETFIKGWLAENGDVSGRPVDIKSWNDRLLISDDYADVVYLVDYQ